LKLRDVTALRRLGILGALIVFGLAAAGPANAATTRRCAAYSFKHKTIPWRAGSIRTVNTSCTTARALARSYAVPRNCQLAGPCHILGYVCRTTNPDGSFFTETCTRPGHSVRWRGSYASR
jgi:hypothetical protein